MLEIRDAGSVPSEVVEDVLAMLDVEESMLDRAAEERRERAERDVGAAYRRLLRRPRAVPGRRDRSRTRSARPASTTGIAWVALRQCLVCGDVGCCDSSPERHATAHFHETTHPVMESAEPGEDWRWCFVHHTTG